MDKPDFDVTIALYEPADLHGRRGEIRVGVDPFSPEGGHTVITFRDAATGEIFILSHTPREVPDGPL